MIHVSKQRHKKVILDSLIRNRIGKNDSTVSKQLILCQSLALVSNNSMTMSTFIQITDLFPSFRVGIESSDNITNSVTRRATKNKERTFQCNDSIVSNEWGLAEYSSSSSELRGVCQLCTINFSQNLAIGSSWFFERWFLTLFEEKVSFWNFEIPTIT